jgi:hypothetical protein
MSPLLEVPMQISSCLFPVVMRAIILGLSAHFDAKTSRQKSRRGSTANRPTSRTKFASENLVVGATRLLRFARNDNLLG